MIGFLKHLLVATDGSKSGDRAVSFAIALARRQSSDVSICYAVDRTGVEIESFASTEETSRRSLRLARALDVAAESILAEAAKRATDAGIVVATAALEYPPAPAIAAFARARTVDAIVMGTQGKRGFERAVMGSVAGSVLRRASVPTFIVPAEWSDAHVVFDRILVAIDDSDPSDAAAAFARSFAEADEARLVFCTVVKTREFLDTDTSASDAMSNVVRLLAMQTDRARDHGVVSESVVAEGEPADAILSMAATRDSNLIIVGTHGRRGLNRLFVGSVAERIACGSRVPVIVVPASNATTLRLPER